MKTPKPVFLPIFLMLQLASFSQMHWYQNQDGNNLFPYGTYAGQVHPFNSNSFTATYLWFTDNDQYTWKISRISTSGAELKTFFVTGT